MQALSCSFDRLRRLIDAGLILAALGVLLALVFKAALFMDGSHDTWWYHLPWAARLAGLSPADAYVFDDYLDQYFAGFPVLMEWLQGQFWRLTGRAEATSFVALGSLLLFVAFLRLRFRVAPHLTLLALMAVPLIHIHATAGHVDLPGNLALATAILLLIPLFAREEPQRPTDIALFVSMCAVTAHTKLQLIPLVALVFVAGIAAVLLARRRAAHPVTGGRLLAGGLVLILISAVTFYVPLKNATLYGNPFYPMSMKIGPLSLDGPQGNRLSHTERLVALYASRSPRAAPLVMAAPERIDAPGQRRPGATVPPETAPTGNPASGQAVASLNIQSDPLAWVRSVLELGMEPVLGRGLWVLLGAQRPPLPARYGGFFGWYVLFQLILFAVLVGRQPRGRSAILVLFLAVTLVAALVPNQTMLRYYMFWMIVLVSLNLILLQPTGPPPVGSRSSDPQRLFGIVGLVAFLLVVYATRGAFIQPRVFLLEDLIAARRDPGIQARVARHPATCLAGEMAPRVFLYAPLFNPGQDYRLKMGPIAGDRWKQLAACGPGWTPVIAQRADAGLLPPGYPGDPR